MRPFLYPCMHPSNCPLCFFIHFKNTDWGLQLARPHTWLVPYLIKDIRSTLREFTVEVVSITHIRKDCWHPWCGLVTKWQPWGPHPDLVGRVCGDTGNKLPGGGSIWEFPLILGRVLCWDLDSIPSDFLGSGRPLGWTGVRLCLGGSYRAFVPKLSFLGP